MREPERERLSIILNELGVGLAGRGEDLNDVIRRANPALGRSTRCCGCSARQNEQLEQLAVDSDTIMQPLARERAHVSSAIDNMSAVAEATAERRADLEADIERLPAFLRELRPTMTRLGALSDEMTPVLSDLGDVAPDINRFLLELGPVLAGRHPGARLARRGVEDRRRRRSRTRARSSATCGDVREGRAARRQPLADVLDVVPSATTASSG